LNEEVETVVIGAGQAGLAIGYLLAQQSRPYVILEQETEVGSAWRQGRWDSFTLVTPNWSVRLPGFPYVGGDPDGFMARTEVVRHLEQYGDSFAAPVHFGKQVTAVDLISDPRCYRVSAADGSTYIGRNIIVATGSYQFPRPTPVSQAIPKGILQLHSSSYRNPETLPPGAVLVVGSADTGCQIAEEVNESGRKVYLCVGRAGRRPRRYRGKDLVYWAEVLGRSDQTVDQVELPSARYAANPQAKCDRCVRPDECGVRVPNLMCHENTYSTVNSSYTTASCPR
jgi:putative flavoprotein involved in K+ transport